MAFDLPGNNHQGGASSFELLLRRALSLPQMDFETTFYDMVLLCINPSRVYVCGRHICELARLRQLKLQLLADSASVSLLEYPLAHTTSPPPSLAPTPRPQRSVKTPLLSV